MNKPVSTISRGAISELRACAWLMEQGYSVFRNVSPSGLADIVAIDFRKSPAEQIFVDVKTGLEYWASGRVMSSSLSQTQKDLGVKRLIVKADWIGWDTDDVMKLRHPRPIPARRPISKPIVSPARVIEIRANYAAGMLPSKLAKMYGVSRPTIDNVVRGLGVYAS